MISCVLITFNPNMIQLEKTINSLISQVDSIIIVKNSSEEIDIQQDKIHFIQLERNMGIAYAQNRGIEYAIKLDTDFILFSDQDTVYPKDFVNKSILCYKKHETEKIGAIVPLFYNKNKQQYSLVSITKTKSILPTIGNEYFVSHAISSGTICNKTIFNSIGMMNERLFIDWVDAEWCWRLVNQGYKIVCDTNNIIEHTMGDNFKTFLGRKIVVYSDFRNYYFLRNGTYLLFHSKLLGGKDWLSFWNFMFMKSLLIFFTNGFSLKRLNLLLKAILKGLTNNFTLENN